MVSLGQKGEIYAADWLKKQGYTILATNWRTQTGEIDIIALDKTRISACIVFVEVKTLPNTQIEDLDIIISKKKQIKICETAKYFIESNRKYSEMYMRFDVIVVKSNPFLVQPMQTQKILHLKDAFGDCYD